MKQIRSSIVLTRFILPLLKVLKSEYPQLHFYLKSEVTLSIDEYIDDEDKENEESNARSIASARVDMIIEAARQGEESVIVLIIEHKTPGTLDALDWLGGMSYGSNILVGNARIISAQARKYLAAALHNIIGIYDSISLVGLMLSYDDLPMWATRHALLGKVFFEKKYKNFLYALLAMITMALLDKRLVCNDLLIDHQPISHVKIFIITISSLL